MRSTLAISVAVSAVLSQFSYGQAVPTTPPPATPAPAPASAGAQAVAASDMLQLRSLQAVLDARERRQDWHDAARQAAERIQEPALRDQFNQRLAGLIPTLANALMAQPQENALVTVAVYRDPARQGKQAMVAVTFEGLGDRIDRSFFADVLAGMPTPPQAEGIPTSLTFDTEASSYLIFFLGNRQLQAGDIPHPLMGRSVVAALNRERSRQNPPGGGAVAPVPVAPPPTVPRQPRDPVPTDPGAFNEPQNGAVTPSYPPVNDGYYYPGAGVPIVILPNENVATPENALTQRRRQMELEKRYRDRKAAAGSIAPGAPGGAPAKANAPQPGATPNEVRPTSPNYAQPNASNSVTPTSPNYVKPTSPNNVNPTPGQPSTPAAPPTPKAPGTPGGAPAGSTPPAGNPGGPPAAKK